MTSTGQDKSSDALDASSRDFVLWCLEALGLHATPVRAGAYTIEFLRGVHDPASTLPHPYADLVGRRFSFDTTSVLPEDASSPVECLTLQSPLVCWLLGQLRGAAWPLQAAATRQPISVHELTSHLFTQYQVDDGHMHLAGCNLEDRPFLRLSFLHPQPSGAQPQIVHCFGTSDGKLLEETLLAELELDRLLPLAGRTPRLDGEVLQRWIEITRQLCAAQSHDGELLPIAATLVWCKYAEGKLTFSIGQKSVEIPFSGWGRLFVDRRRLPPPYTCPISGRTSYHLAATDDGRITVAEAIATCAASSRRVLADELGLCSETGQRVLPEYLQVCPVTGRKVLLSILRPCSMCQQMVSPQSLDDDRCGACRHLAAAAKADPRMARILGAHPKLDRWRSWKMSETRTVQVLVGTSAWKRLLVVLDKQTLDVLYLAGSGRLSGKWTEATDVQRADWIG